MTLLSKLARQAMQAAVGNSTHVGQEIIDALENDAANDLVTGLTAGVVTASKALTVDTNKDIATLRNVTLSGGVIYAGTTGANKITIPDNLAAGLVVGEGANAYITLVTTNGAEQVLISKDLGVATTVTFSGATGVNKLLLTDNLASALVIAEGSNAYITIVTTNSGEKIQFAKAVEFASTVLCSGAVTCATTVTFTGTTGTNKILVTDNLASALVIGEGANAYITLVTTNGAESITFGKAVTFSGKVTTGAGWAPYGITTPVAAAGSTVTDAGQLGTASRVHITSDSAAKGVKLPAGVLNDKVEVVNNSGTAAKLYAAAGGTINGLSADAAVVIAASKGVILFCTAADTWIAFDMAAKATAA